MSAAPAAPPAVGRPGTHARPSQGALFDESSARRHETAPSLDDLVSHGWETLNAAVPARCPVCADELVPGAQGGGTCGRCAATLT